MRWFMHDSNAHTDAKLRKVMMRFGADGYGLYWYCLELIAGNVDAGRYTFELEHDAEILAYDLKIDSLRVEEIMRYLVSLGLFENTDGRITCLKMASRLDARFTRSPELQQVIKQAKTGNVLRLSEDCLSTVGAIGEDSIGEIHPTDDAFASSDSKSPSSDPDRDWLWRDGTKLLAQRGLPDRKVRSCIGGWLKKSTAHQVREAVVSADRAQTGDPVPYITRILNRETRVIDAMMVGLE